MQSATTRRGLFAGAIAATAAPALAHAASRARPKSIEAKAKTVRRGRAIAVSRNSGALVVAHAARRTIAIAGAGRKRIIDVGGQPLELAISPGGKLVAVTTASWDEPGLVIVELPSGKIVERLDAGAAPFGVAFSASGKRLAVVGGDENGEIRVFDTSRFRQRARGKLGDCPRDVVAVPGSESFWVALNGPDRVALVSARSGRVRRSLATERLPERLAISPSGKRLLVSHGDPRGKHVSEIRLESGEGHRLGTGRQPSAVAWAGNRRLIALGGAGRIVVIGAGGRRESHEVGGSPRGLAVAGNRAWTVDALSGAIARIRI